MTSPGGLGEAERILIDVIARDLATEVIRDVRNELGGIGPAGERSAQGVDRATRSMTGGLRSVWDTMKGMAALAATGFGLDKLKDFASSAIEQASDLNEASTKLEAVFGSGTAAVNSFAAAGAAALGQSNLEVKNAAATFGVFGKAAGLAGEANAKFSTDLVSLSTDLASFYNEDPASVVEALGAGLRGEAEPLRRFGILMDDATLRNKALSMGLITTTKDALEPQQKVLAAQALIMEQTTLAQGDFARTSGGLANQQRILAATWTDMKGKLGTAFLPGVTAVVTALNTRLMPALDTASTRVLAFVDVVRSGEGFDALGGPDTIAGRAALMFYGLNERLKDELIPDLRASVSEAWSVLSTGEFTDADGGFGADSPFVKFLFTLRDFGLDSLDKLRGIWDKLWHVGEQLWPHIQSIGESLGAAFSVLSDHGLTLWDLLLAGFDKAADLMNTYLVPAFEWLARFMKENPDSVLAFVGVIGAVVIATKLWAAAQAVLNVILTANPIGVVVVALAAFAAAVVWAYNNVEWFRDLVDGAWDVISTAVTWAWENVLRPVLGYLWDRIQSLGGSFQMLWETVQSVWNWISDKVSTVWNWLRDNVFTPIGNAISGTIGWFSDLGSNVETIWDGIGSKISGVYTDYVEPVWNNIKGFIDSVGSFFSGIWKGVSDAAGWIGTKITDITNKIKEFLGQNFDQNGVQANADGSITLRNDNPLGLTDFNFKPGGATGGFFTRDGMVSGSGGPRADLVDARLSPNEFVVNAAATARHLPLLYQINNDTGYAQGGLVQAAYDQAFKAITGYAGPLLDQKGTSATTPTATSGGGLYTGAIPAGAAVERWRPLALSALATVGAYLGRNLLPFIGNMLLQISTESSGNPNALNLTDSNARRGIPSGGLLQVIQPTFESALRGTPFANLISRGRFDPWANFISSILYGINRYGSLDKAYRGVAYDNGGMWPTGTSGINASGRSEAVLTGEETDTYRAVARELVGARSSRGGGATVTVERGAVQIDVHGNLDDPAEVEAQLERAIRRILADAAERSM